MQQPTEKPLKENQITDIVFTLCIANPFSVVLVYKAMCDNLPCAAKILHPTLFQSNDPGTMTIMKQFQQECSVLSAIRHPNVVQYLGLYQDPETRLPVLLMELMDDNLTRFLERFEEPLPYHIQVNICHDIALALAYLHSNDIIHRDLSSNNVLLIGAGNRAKVTDFGMAKLFNINRATMTPLTMCPGTLAYMSPEALDDPPVYTKKLDSFSFGVLSIQIDSSLWRTSYTIETWSVQSWRPIYRKSRGRHRGTRTPSREQHGKSPLCVFPPFTPVCVALEASDQIP